MARTAFAPYVYFGSARTSGMWIVRRSSAARSSPAVRTGTNRVRLQPLVFGGTSEVRGYTQQLAIETVDVRPRTIDPAQPRRMLHHGLKHRLQIETPSG